MRPSGILEMNSVASRGSSPTCCDWFTVLPGSIRRQARSVFRRASVCEIRGSCKNSRTTCDGRNSAIWRRWNCTAADASDTNAARVRGAQQPLRVPIGGQYQWRDPLWEAASALQGNRLRGAALRAVLDSALIVEAAGALREIRRQVPGLAGRVMDESPATLIIGLSSAMGARLRSIGNARKGEEWELPLLDGVPITGESVFDSLSRRLNVNAAIVWDGCDDIPNSFCLLSVRFADYVNVPVVAAAYKRVPEVRFAHRDDALITFVHARIDDADETGQAWLVSFFEGQGDCPAGCSGWIRSVVHFDRISRRAELRVRDATWPP